MTRSFSLRTALLAAVMIAAPASAASNLIVNGGFENTGFGGTGSYYNLGNSGADHAVPGDFGFAVTLNDVDLIANGVYAPFLATGGAYNLDLNGYNTGAIGQTFATQLGRAYRVSIDYSQNGGGKSAVVNVNGSGIGTLIGSGSWQNFTTTFAGTGAPTVFDITSIVGSSGGITLDNISVSDVPEPATWAMMLTGFGMLGFAMRKRQKTVAA
ncbi:MAG: PEPxxWA-CTERM sorting domain-containing protein [Sandarakinorhabdus sp.]|nr:PEPxxWA-CTERM sorting domain-containing protein [Sandarakinorhabdus sp.]